LRGREESWRRWWSVGVGGAWVRVGEGRERFI
jgi:hypothetical protein